jgi:hypothetical protein
VPCDISSELGGIVGSEQQLRLVSLVHGHVEGENVLLEQPLLHHHIKYRETGITHRGVCESNDSVVSAVNEVQLGDESECLITNYYVRGRVSGSNGEAVFPKMAHEFSRAEENSRFLA